MMRATTAALAVIAIAAGVLPAFASHELTVPSQRTELAPAATLPVRVTAQTKSVVTKRCSSRGGMRRWRSTYSTATSCT